MGMDAAKQNFLYYSHTLLCPTGHIHQEYLVCNTFPLKSDVQITSGWLSLLAKSRRKISLVFFLEEALPAVKKKIGLVWSDSARRLAMLAMGGGRHTDILWEMNDAAGGWEREREWVENVLSHSAAKTDVILMKYFIRSLLLKISNLPEKMRTFLVHKYGIFSISLFI